MNVNSYCNDNTSSLKKRVLGFVFAEKGLIADLSLQGPKINKIAK